MKLPILYFSEVFYDDVRHVIHFIVEHNNNEWVGREANTNEIWCGHVAAEVEFADDIDCKSKFSYGILKLRGPNKFYLFYIHDIYLDCNASCYRG